MRLKLAAIALGIVVVASAFGASAFTTATVERSASIDVKSDSSGLIGLNTSSTEFVTSDNGGLSIDVSGANSAGVNQNSTLEIGSQTSPAFNITNNFQSSRDLNVDYTLGTEDNVAADNVQFLVYNSTGSNVATATEETSATISNADPGETFAVAIKINTTNLSSSDDLSGTLNVTA